MVAGLHYYKIMLRKPGLAQYVKEKEIKYILHLGIVHTHLIEDNLKYH